MTNVKVFPNEVTVKFKDVPYKDYFILRNHLCLKIRTVDTDVEHLMYDAYDLESNRPFYLSDQSLVIPVSDISISYTINTNL